MHPQLSKTIVKKVFIGAGIVLVFGVGILIGRFTNAQPDLYASNGGIGITNAKDLNQFWGIWKLLNEKYPFKDKIPNDTERIHGAISGMVASFNDPYTVFFPPKQAKLFEEDVKGAFGGVGMEVGVKQGLLTVVTPIKGSPAERANIQPGDVILKINETSTEGVTVDEAISLIRGTAGTSVDLTLARKGSADFITVTLVREIINVPVIKTELINGVFIINLYSFSENSAQEFEKALLEFKKTKSKKLIIDVRNNPGGYLNAAIDMASHFIPQGKIVLREDQGDDQPELVYRSQGSELGLPTGIKIMVLVNEGSASASEILAGALVEHNAAQLVGTQTFGKGSVQELIPLSDGSSLKVTVAKWFTPNGVSISEKGITPTYIVTEKPTEKKPDPILEKAFSLFK